MFVAAEVEHSVVAWYQAPQCSVSTTGFHQEITTMSGLKRILVGSEGRFDGVPPINVYLMRLVYALMLVFLGKDSWAHIISHQAQWQPMEAMAWSVWAAFATLSLLGLFHTVRMIPLLLLEVFYKLVWLSIVAYPLWRTGTLSGSEAEGMTNAFLWVVLPIVAMPWPYITRTYLLGRLRKTSATELRSA
jgi:hypothetical protein